MYGNQYEQRNVAIVNLTFNHASRDLHPFVVGAAAFEILYYTDAVTAYVILVFSISCGFKFDYYPRVLKY